MDRRKHKRRYNSPFSKSESQRVRVYVLSSVVMITFYYIRPTRWGRMRSSNIREGKEIVIRGGRWKLSKWVFAVYIREITVFSQVTHLKEKKGRKSVNVTLLSRCDALLTEVEWLKFLHSLEKESLMEFFSLSHTCHPVCWGFGKSGEWKFRNGREINRNRGNQVYEGWTMPLYPVNDVLSPTPRLTKGL